MVIAHYKRHVKRAFESEMDWYASAPNLVCAIRRAAHSRFNHKICMHQRRLGAALLAKAGELLVVQQHAIAQAAAVGFSDLLQVVAQHSPKGCGTLFHYDVSVRLAHHLKLDVLAVYLHAGTRVGAKRWQPDRRHGPTLAPDLVARFRGLSCDHIENLLCIYAQHIVPKS